MAWEGDDSFLIMEVKWVGRIVLEVEVWFLRLVKSEPDFLVV